MAVHPRKGHDGCPVSIVGGIYTVLRSKAPVTVQEYGESYLLLGPYIQKRAELEVETIEPTDEYLRKTIQTMKSHQVHLVFGRWLVEGSPLVLLFDLGSVAHRSAEWKADLWEQASVPSLDSDVEMNDAVIFGYLVAWFLGEVGDASCVCMFPSNPLHFLGCGV